jgi:hypothetical protein
MQAGEDAALALASLALPFGFAAVFFSRWVFRDLSVPSVLLAYCALMFTLSVHMQELVLFEIMGSMRPETRRQLWQVDLHALILMLTVVTPLSLCWSVVRQRRLPAGAQGVLTLALYALFIYCYSLLGQPLAPVPGAARGLERAWAMLSIEYAVGRLGVLGVAAMAMLSGFGAVQSPYKQMAIFLLPYSDREIASLEQRALQTLILVAAKKKRIALLVQQPQQQPQQQQEQQRSELGWAQRLAARTESLPLRTALLAAHLVCAAAASLARLALGWPGSDEANVEVQVAALRQEISSLEGFHRELFLDIAELHADRHMSLFSRTYFGMAYFFAGYFLSAYCVYKCVMAAINILLSRDPKRDPISIGFEIFFMLFNVSIDVQFWSQLFSLVMVGCLVVSSVRGFLLTVAKIFNHISTSISSSAVVLLLLQVMGMYFISFTLLMRINLPEEYRHVVTDVLGDLQFSFYHRFFDRIFLGSAMLTIALIAVLHQKKVQRTKVDAYEDKLA